MKTTPEILAEIERRIQFHDREKRKAFEREPFADRTGVAMHGHHSMALVELANWVLARTKPCGKYLNKVVDFV